MLVNQLNSIIQQTERDHYAILFSENKSYLQTFLTFLKDIINKKKTAMLPNYFINSLQTIKDKSKMADSFNKYFLNVGLAKYISCYVIRQVILLLWSMDLKWGIIK